MLVIVLIVATLVLIWCVVSLRDLKHMETIRKQESEAMHTLLDSVLQYLDEGGTWNEDEWQAWNRKRNQQ